MHPPVSLMSSNVFWRPSSAAGQRCVHRIAHLLSQSAVVPLLTPPHFSASLLWVFSSAAGLFTPFPFLCPCSSVLVGVVRTAAAAVTGPLCSSYSLLVFPRLSHLFWHCAARWWQRQGPLCDPRHTWFTELLVCYVSINLCFACVFLVIVM